jgi:hypothetical protein
MSKHHNFNEMKSRQLDLFGVIGKVLNPKGYKATFFNTNESEQEEVKKKEKTFMTQETAILQVFIQSRIKWTATQMHEQLMASGKIHQDTPKGSIGRGFTNLKNGGYLEKVEGDLAKGKYNASEHYYKLVDNGRK